MFVEKLLNGKRIFYSDKLNVEHFFTSRDFLIKENLEMVAKYLNIDPKNLIKPTQTHSKNVEIFDENKREYPDCDGLILDKKNFGLYLNFADCVPVIIYDNKNNIVSNVHSGWRGTVEKIGILALQKMQKFYNTKKEDTTVVVGPAISFECFETSKEIIEKLSSTIKNKENLFTSDHADLKNIVARQFLEFGVEDIDVCPFCTVKDNDKFFSYRLENKTKNRHSAVVKL